MNPVPILNRLLELHSVSLPMYFVSAPPYRRQGEERTWATLQHIVDDQRLMVDKIADHIESLDGTPDRGEFPMEFTGLHDLSLEYLGQKALQRQKQEVVLIEQLSNQLEDGSQAKALAQESLGAAKAHVQSLEESLASAV